MKKVLSVLLVLSLVISSAIIGSFTSFAAKEKSVSEGIYTIQSKLGSNMMLDVAGGSRNSGANIQIYKANSTTSQLFWIKRSGSYYTITSLRSDMVLDVQGGNIKSKSNVQQYTPNGTKAQQWKFYDAGKGYVYIACGSCALDVSGGKSANGTNVQIYTPNSSTAQAWKLNKIYSVDECSSFKGKVDSSDYAIVKIDNSLITKNGKQNATVKLKTYDSSYKSNSDKVVVILQDLTGKTIWSGIKKGGDTIKLGDDNVAYKIFVERYDSGDDFISNGNDFLRARTVNWGLENAKKSQIYSK